MTPEAEWAEPVALREALSVPYKDSCFPLLARHLCSGFTLPFLPLPLTSCLSLYLPRLFLLKMGRRPVLPLGSARDEPRAHSRGLGNGDGVVIPVTSGAEVEMALGAHRTPFWAPCPFPASCPSAAVQLAGSGGGSCLARRWGWSAGGG